MTSIEVDKKNIRVKGRIKSLKVTGDVKINLPLDFLFCGNTSYWIIIKCIPEHYFDILHIHIS